MGSPFPGPWSFKYHPWARGMHDCEAEVMVGQKSAQMGYTEVALNKTFYAIDKKGASVLYMLPASTPDAKDFSTARFDPALEMSPHLKALFSDTKNIGHKRAGSANLYIRGSRSRSQLKSIPVGLIIFDEVDEMVQKNIPLAVERASGQLEKQFFYLSTPTIDKYGINEYFVESSQNHFMFACPHCKRLTELIFPECLVVTAEEHTDRAVYDSFLKCKECDHKLEHDTKPEWLEQAEWVPSFTDRVITGFYINQLYSFTVKPYELAIAFLKSQTNQADEQEFYNSKLGLTHIVEGARVTKAEVESSIGTYKSPDRGTPHQMVTMGVDVGKWLHYEITQWIFDGSLIGNDVNLSSHGKVLRVGKCLNFEELDNLMRQFKINFCVIDANPERRKALEFAQRFWGFVRLCFYGNSVNGRQIIMHSEDEHTITVDRTSWLDLALARFRNGRITLPIDIGAEYKDHIQAPVRIYDKDGNGNPIGKYVTGNEDDHYAHARNYCELALRLAAAISNSEDISGVL
jgi:hypothetical protein